MPHRQQQLSSTLQRMALRRPLDYVVKPVWFYLAILLVYLIACSILAGTEHAVAELHHSIPVVLLTSTPFIFASLLVVTKLDRIHLDLAQLALTDALTELPNRRSFTLQIDNHQRHGAMGFLLILDADHFKRVNDTYGHAIGDECLKAIANRLREISRPNDVTTAAELRSIGQSLCKGIHIDAPGLDQPLRLTMSVGATETHEDENVAAALQRADEALYVAKSTGRAKMVTWTKSMADKIA